MLQHLAGRLRRSHITRTISPHSVWPASLTLQAREELSCCICPNLPHLTPELTPIIPNVGEICQSLHCRKIEANPHFLNRRKNLSVLPHPRIWGPPPFHYNNSRIYQHIRKRRSRVQENHISFYSASNHRLQEFDDQKRQLLCKPYICYDSMIRRNVMTHNNKYSMKVFN